MAEELQGLLDRIRKEGLDRAESEAASILEEAKKKAAAIVAKAEADAKERITQAEAEAEKFEKRSISAVEHAARDVVLSVGDAVERVFASILQEATVEALSGPEFHALIRDVVRAYSENADSPQLEVLLNEEQQQTVTTYLKKELSERMGKTLSVEGTRGIISGFSVVLRDKGVEHDFRGETLTKAFLALLRPQLGNIVKQAMKKEPAKS